MAGKKNPRATRGIQHKALDTFVQSVQDRMVKQVFSVMGNVDNGGDVIHKRAFEKTLRERFDQIRTLWQHDGDDPPIGVPLELKEIDRAELPAEVIARYPDCEGALLGVIEYLDTPRGNEVLTGIQRGAIKKNSIGYSAIKYDYEDTGDEVIRHLREVVLWDVSPVNWGMNEATLNLKQAQPWRDTGIADENARWHTPTLADFTAQDWDDLSEPEVKRIASHFAWIADSQPRAFADLQLAHHEASRDGKGKAVWSAVQAAMQGLATIAMSDEDRQQVYDHLAKHYAQFGKEPLPYAMIETMRQATALCATATGIADQLKVGRMISSANLALMQDAVGKIKQASTTLDDLIGRAQGDAPTPAPAPEPAPTQASVPAIVLEPPPTIVVAKNDAPRDQTQLSTPVSAPAPVNETPSAELAQVEPAPSEQPVESVEPASEPVQVEPVQEKEQPAQEIAPEPEPEPTPIANILDVPPTFVPVNSLTLARHRALGVALRNKV